MELVTTPKPHFIPGYTGYCPQYIFRVGKTYGTLSHKLLVDPCIGHSKNIITTNNEKGNFREERPSFREVDLIKTREKERDAIYKYPLVPGYDGLIPRLNNKVGQRFLVSATESIAEFEKQRQYLKCEGRKRQHRAVLQGRQSLFERNIGERSLTDTQYVMPLAPVRPEAEGIFRSCNEHDMCKRKIQPYSKDNPPHFLDVNDPDKYIIKGYSGHIPFASQRVGENNQVQTKAALCEFVNNYHHRRAPEWVPQSQAGVGTSQPSYNNYTIYHKHTGIVPSYAGHVPGEITRFGNTFGTDTVDAKRWLREER